MDKKAKQALEKSSKMMAQLAVMNDNDLDMLSSMASFILQDRARQYYADMHMANSVEEAISGY